MDVFNGTPIIVEIDMWPNEQREREEGSPFKRLRPRDNNCPLDEWCQGKSGSCEFKRQVIVLSSEFAVVECALVRCPSP